MSISSANQLISMAIFEGDIEGVLDNGDLLVTSGIMGLESPQRIPGLLGGVSDGGIYQGHAGGGAQKGDKVLLCRVHPGASGVTHALRVIPGPNRHKNSKEIRYAEDMPAGRTRYPTGTMKDGDVRIAGDSGGGISVQGGPLKSEVFIGNGLKAGISINNIGKDTSLTTVSHIAQNVTSGHRLFCGDVSRVRGGIDSDSTARTSGHELDCVFKDRVGRPRGLWPGLGSSSSAFLDSIRNPALSQYRLIINEFSENSFFKGWDHEAGSANKPNIEKYSNPKEKKALDPGTALHLEPYQLIEIMGGNVVNRQGDLLDPNYGIVKLGDADGKPSGGSESVYEEARRISRRSIGYHFQMSTNSLSSDSSNDVSNFVLALDKEGVLKVNVPRSSLTGNVLYPTNANFNSADTDSVITEASGSSIKSEEKIPVLLRDKLNEAVLPSNIFLTTSGQLTSTDNKRSTGIRHTNEDSYFQGIKEVLGGDGRAVRINPTKYHNMYAAAEAIIGNKISGVMIPTETAFCGGIETGNKVGECFERHSKGGDGDGTDSKVEPKHMSVVQVAPSAPAIDPGGGVIVAGEDRSISVVAGDESARINVPYSNSFTVSGEGDNLSAKGEENKRNPGGKSANLNFEGSMEVSIGSDDHDSKSILLDTAGSLVAWFGADKAGRSMVLQTDGEVLLNVGGASGDSFNVGRFDLRVNVTDKGWLGDDDFVPAGGPHASDYIISISENGLVIAGMKPDTPMIIRNDGDLSIESSSKIILGANSIELREANRSPSKTYKAPQSQDQEQPTAESVIEDIQCVLDLLAEITE